jgi:hypothetical protein
VVARREEDAGTNILPAFDGLETIHHGTVESISIGSDQRDDQEDVQLDDVAVLPPMPFRVGSETPTTVQQEQEHTRVEHARIGAIAGRGHCCKTNHDSGDAARRGSEETIRRI